MKVFNYKIPEKVAPYSGIILFAVILLASNFAWKYTVLGDESDNMVTFFGLDISAPFVWMARHVALASEAILNMIGYNMTLVEAKNILRHENGYSVQIIWACTGLKQAYIFLCIIAFNRGSWRKKLWYIPLGLLAVYLFNIFRITFIVACIKNNPHWFHFLHLYLFKYLFYVVIFGLWLIWEERIAGKKKRLYQKQ